MDAQTNISSNLMQYIENYRKDKELALSEQSMIADAMCGIELAISGMQVDNRTEELLKRAASVVSSYHWVLEMMDEK